MINQAKVLAQELSNAANDPKTMQKVAQQRCRWGRANRRRSRWRPPCSRRPRGTNRPQQQMQQMAKQMAQQIE